MKKIVTYIGIIIGFWFIGQGQQVLADEGYVSSLDAKEAIDVVKAYSGGADGTPDDLFRIYDLVEDQEVLLGLKKLHTQDLRRLATNRIAVCAEYISKDGQEYMLWFDVEQGYETQEYFSSYSLEEVYHEGMRVHDILIHKVNGAERIKWTKNDNGIWEVNSLSSIDEQAHSHHDALSKALEKVDPNESAVCPECGSQTKSITKSDVGLKKHRCPSCKKEYNYDQYWFQRFSLPFESVHVCEKCDALVELCPVCLKKR